MNLCSVLLKMITEKNIVVTRNKRLNIRPEIEKVPVPKQLYLNASKMGVSGFNSRIYR